MNNIISQLACVIESYKGSHRALEGNHSFDRHKLQLKTLKRPIKTTWLASCFNDIQMYGTKGFYWIESDKNVKKKLKL